MCVGRPIHTRDKLRQVRTCTASSRDWVPRAPYTLAIQRGQLRLEQSACVGLLSRKRAQCEPALVSEP